MIENAICENIIQNGDVVAIRVIPNDGFILKINNGNGNFSYSDFIQFPINKDFLGCIEAVPVSEIPEPVEDEIPDSSVLERLGEVLIDD